MSQDAFDLATAQIVNAPDVRAWPITTAITQITITPSSRQFPNGNTVIEFDKKDGPGRWPDVTPPGWAGPLQYTVWLFRMINGAPVGSAFIQMWYTRDGCGDAVSDYDINWYYSSRWAPLYGSGRIPAGESIGMMVTSGNQRDSVGPNSVAQRSNVVVFAAPVGDNGVFTFAATEPAPVPVPPPAPEPTPVPVPAPAPTPGVDHTAQLDRMEAILVALKAKFL